MRPWAPVLLAIVATLAQAPAWPARAGEPPRPVCLSNPETRDAVQLRKAIPPFRAVAAALRDEGGDLVAIRLCRPDDKPLVYDVAVLRHDGRLVHIYVDAGTGTLQAARKQP